MRQRQPREKIDAHLDFVRSLPCVVCLTPFSSEACHIRFSDARAAKFNPGSHKPSDWWTLPMCRQCHARQHSGDEVRFWQCEGIDPLFVSAMLYLSSGNNEGGNQIVANARESFLARRPREFA